MFPSKTLLSLAFIALAAVNASPLSRRTGRATLSIAARLNERGSLSIAEKDRARAQSMKQTGHGLGKRSDTTVSVTNAATYYSAQVGVGDPETTYTLLIDTGSSDTFVGAGTQQYTPTSNSIDTGNTVSVSYGSGSWSGEEWLDTVTLSPGLVISNQSIGVASTVTGFDGFDGILGVGPTDLTKGTVSNTGTVPTVMDNLVSQGKIDHNILGIAFRPTSAPAAEYLGGGDLTFGGIDSYAFIGQVGYVPLTQTSPASRYWGIDQSITYGSDNHTVLSLAAGIVDTGTTLVLIATDAFIQYQNLTGATLDPTTDLLTIDKAGYQNLQSLFFNIGNNSYELTADAQVWPRSLNSAIGGSTNGIYLIINDIGHLSAPGFGFINGYTFLERYYSVFDTDNQRVGFASTAYTNSTSNCPGCT